MLYMDLTTFTDEQLEALAEQVRHEIDMRNVMINAAKVSHEASRMYHGAALKNLPDGEAADWVQPHGAHDAYPMGWPVVHNGKNWISLTSANVWEPGVASWREVTNDNVYPEWIQPTGSHDAYQYEDTVWYEGGPWKSSVNNNVWVPGQYGWDFIGELPVDPGAEDPGTEPEEPIDPEEPTDPESPVEPDPEEPIDPEPVDPDPVDPDVPEEPDVAVWVQPTGAHDAYPVDAVVFHKDKFWINTFAGNSYEPGVYGWDELV